MKKSFFNRLADIEKDIYKAIEEARFILLDKEDTHFIDLYVGVPFDDSDNFISSVEINGADEIVLIDDNGDFYGLEDYDFSVETLGQIADALMDDEFEIKEKKY